MKDADLVGIISHYSLMWDVLALLLVAILVFLFLGMLRRMVSDYLQLRRELFEVMCKFAKAANALAQYVEEVRLDRPGEAQPQVTDEDDADKSGARQSSGRCTTSAAGAQRADIA